MDSGNNTNARISCASSSQQSTLIPKRKTKKLSKHNLIYSVIKFNTEYGEDETYSVIPTLWLKENDKYSFWPRKDIRNCIIKCKKPQNDWVLYPVTVLAKYNSYEHALQKEKRLMEERSTTESESQLGRGHRKKKISRYISKENDKSSSNSSKNEISDNDSIPELNNSLHEQDDGTNQNIDDHNSQILNIDEIPIVIEAENNVIPAEDDIIFARNRKNNDNKNTHRNIDMLPQLPMDCFEDINIFEIILAFQEAQSQLVNMLIMIGGTTIKDAMKRALQKLFTNNLASKCSWTGAKNNFKLKDLKIIMCMKNAIKEIYPTVTEAQFEEILKTWFRQANLRLNRENIKNARNNNAINDNARNDA